MEITEPTQKKQRTHRNTKRTVKVTTEKDSLEMHVEICQIRYQQLESRLTIVDNRLTKFESDLKDLRDTTNRHFDEIKSLLTQARDEKFKVMLATAGSVIIALVGMFGYLINKVG